MLIDTHLHIIDKKALSYPWLEDAPALNRDSLYEDYATEAKRLGIVGTVHMEVDVAESDIQKETDYVKAISKQEGSLLLGVTANCRPEYDSFASYFEQVSADPFVKSLRRCLHTMPDDLSEQPVYRANIKRFEGSRLTYDIVMLPRQIKQTLSLIDSAPNTRFILNHCGVPDIKGGAYESWAKGIADIAKRPNVVGKISGVIAYADPANWTVSTIRPYVEHTIQSFGWDRVIWGSDFPVCTLGGSLSTWVALTHVLVEGCSADEKAQLFHRNVSQLWNFTL